VIGAIAAGSVAAIAGATYARARYHRDRGPSISRRAATDSQADKRGVAAGWAGPLFWPNASGDLFDYVFGNPDGADRFWSYGYDEILNGYLGQRVSPASVSAGHAARRRLPTMAALLERRRRVGKA